MKIIQLAHIGFKGFVQGIALGAPGLQLTAGLQFSKMRIKEKHCPVSRLACCSFSVCLGHHWKNCRSFRIASARHTDLRMSLVTIQWGQRKWKKVEGLIIRHTAQVLKRKETYLKAFCPFNSFKETFSYNFKASIVNDNLANCSFANRLEISISPISSEFENYQ